MEQPGEKKKDFTIKDTKDKLEEELYIGNDTDRIAELAKLKLENENYQQEVYGLRRTLELTKTMVRDLQEENELLEQRHALLIQKDNKAQQRATTNQHNAQEDYEQRIAYLEAKLADETEEKKQLQNLLEQRKGEKRHSSTTINFDSSLEDQEREKREQAEILIDQLKNDSKELQRVIVVNKEQLAEKTEALVALRGELHCIRGEMLSLGQNPASDSSKGNSLFGEVEDRRLDAMGKMRTLRKKYEEAKHLCRAKTAEIKALKIESAEMLRKWEDSTIVTPAENSELISKYKSRIEDLERKLKVERKKDTDLQEYAPSDLSYDYGQFVINDLKRERQELRSNLEDLSTQLLVLEEVKFNLANQVRHWRHKTNALEVQLRALKTELESDNFASANQHTSPETLNSSTSNKRNGEPELISDLPGVPKVLNNIPYPANLSVPITEITAQNEEVEGETESVQRVTTDDRSTDHPYDLKSMKVIRFSKDTKASNETKSTTAKKQGMNPEYPIVFIDS